MFGIRIEAETDEYAKTRYAEKWEAVNKDKTNYLKEGGTILSEKTVIRYLKEESKWAPDKITAIRTLVIGFSFLKFPWRGKKVSV